MDSHYGQRTPKQGEREQWCVTIASGKGTMREDVLCLPSLVLGNAWTHRVKCSVGSLPPPNCTPIKVDNLNSISWQRCANSWVLTRLEQQQSDGLMERWNQTLLQNVSACVKDYSEDWEDFVKPICLVYNTSAHATTEFSPSFLMFGRQAKLPVEIMYGTPEPISTTTTEYTQKLKSSLTEAYQ